jgi:hypothetical protein
MSFHSRPLRPRFVFAALLLLTATTAATGTTAPSIYDPRSYGLIHREPGADSVAVRSGIEFGRVGARALRFDVASPGAGPSARPAIVFVSGSGDDPASPLRSWQVYRDWMRAAAARGFVAVTGESDRADLSGSIHQLFSYLDQHAAELGIDPSRIGAFATGASVRTVLPIAMSDSNSPKLRALALYYGGGTAPSYRPDLPLFVVIAGKAAPTVVTEQRTMVKAAIDAGASCVVAEVPALGPAFESLDPGVESRAIVAQTLAFLEAQLLSSPAPPADEPERAAARHALRQVYSQDLEPAHEYFNELTKGPARDDRHLWEVLAWIRRAMGLPAGEAAALEQAIVAAPDDVGLRTAHARLLGQFENWVDLDATLSPVASLLGNDALSLGLLGLARLHLGRPEEAIGPLESAAQLGAGPQNQYNLACAYARTGHKDAALRSLGAAIDAGFSDSRTLAEDPDLESLRGEPRFVELSRRIAPAPPAETPQP